MRELAGQYPRYGYRRIRVFLGRDGHRMGADRTYRLWRGEQLQVPRKRPRRRVAGARPKPTRATGANQVWAYDFVFDACANGQQLKCLTVIDEYTREALAIDVAGSIRSTRVIEVLTQLISLHGAPRALKSDNGPEFVSLAILRWLTTAGIDCVLSDPGKPWQNGTDESFNGTPRLPNADRVHERDREKVHRPEINPERADFPRIGGPLNPGRSDRYFLPGDRSTAHSRTAAEGDHEPALRCAGVHGRTSRSTLIRLCDGSGAPARRT
jgi:transposase InsO family protein